MPGMFCVEDPPVSRNDVLRDGDNTYTIRGQLGLGNYSSVWLAKTESSTQQPGQFRLVAVKISNHNASTSDGLELALARKQIRLELSGEETGEIAKKLLLPESTFAFNDSKGSLRRAFTFGDLYGLTVFEYAKGCPNRRMEWAAAKRCALDTISGLAFLHQNGIGHGGQS
jgi:serine/threonine protein kinase